MKLFKKFETELKVVTAIKWSMVVLFLATSFVFFYQFMLEHKFLDIFVSIIFFLSSFISSLELVGKSKLTKLNIIFVLSYYSYVLSVFAYYILNYKLFAVILITVALPFVFMSMFFKNKSLKITNIIFNNYNAMVDIQNELSKLNETELNDFKNKITEINKRNNDETIDNIGEQKNK
jgi:hypothetical protein